MKITKVIRNCVKNQQGKLSGLIKFCNVAFCYFVNAIKLGNISQKEILILLSKFISLSVKIQVTVLL